MPTSPYAAVGPKLVDNGYSSIPIRPGSKLPGWMLHGEWWGRMDWSQFCDRLPTRHELSVWQRYPEAGVCVACGFAGLVAIDIDTEDDAVVEAIMSVLPPSPVAKRGAKGQTLFYRGSPAIKSRPFNVAGGRALDLLAHGRQTVLPPTVHPDTGRPYEWITSDTLLETLPEQLPALEDDISARLEEALAPFGLKAYLGPRASGDGASHTGSGDSVWRDINEHALANLDRWVPQLGLAKTRAHRGGYRAIAEWRPSSSGRPISARSPNLSFNAKGIKDMGDDRTYTSIDVVMEARGLDVASASDWLAERIGFETAPPGDMDTVAFARRNFAKNEIVNEVENAVPTRALGAPRGEVDPFEPEEAGGLIGAIAAWSLKESYRPCKPFAMLAAVGFMSALCNRRYVAPSGFGTNLYLIGLSPPSFGKEHPQKSIKTLAVDSRHQRLLGPSKVSSGSAIEKLVRRAPNAIMVMDELGIMLQGMSGRNAPAHADSIRQVLLDIYGKSDFGNLWFGQETADQNKDNSPVHSPTLSLLGFSTATEFYKGLPESALRDGFAARLLTIETNERGARQKTSPLLKVPESLLRQVQAVMDAFPVQSTFAGTAYYDAHEKAPVHPAEWADAEAETEWNRVDQWQEETIREDGALYGIVGRAAAHTQKLATLRAVSRNASDPRLTAEDVRWGYAFVQHALDSLDKGVRRYVADSPYEALCNNIVEALSKAGLKGLAYSTLGNRKGIKKVPDRDRKAAVEDLVQRGVLVRTGKRGQTLVLAETGESDSENEKLAA